MTTYYVSSIIGSDTNAGTSATNPFASLQEAANVAKPGDTVEVMNGTYTGPAGGVVVNITTSGTASAPITFEAAPGQTPIVDSSGCWQGININANYIVINGFTVIGDEKSYTLAQATAGYSSSNPSLDGSGIVVNGDGTHVPNHIIIENNIAYNEPGAGISVVHADYVTILNNVVHDTSNWSAFGSSGISIWESMNSDTNPGVHMTISGNTVYNNAQLVPTLGGNVIYDGEGIILDTNPNFVGQWLVENNTVYHNGSSGIESNRTDNATITGNTIYENDLNSVQAASNAEIFINQSNDNTVTNNILTNPNLPPPPPPPPGQVVNGNFGTNDFTGWTLGGNYTSTTYGPEIYIDTHAQGSSTYAVGMGSIGPDGTLSQTITTTPGQTYTLSFWLQNESAGTNDFHAIWNGQTLLSLTNAPQSNYTQYTYTVTATSGTAALEFSAANGPSQWDLDNISLTSNGSPPPPPPPPAAPVISAFSPNTGGQDTTSSTLQVSGKATDGTVTLLDGTTVVGTAAVTSGAWSITDTNAANGTHVFTATDTDANGTSAASSAFNVTVNVPPPPPPPTNLVTNPGFETGDFSGWTLSGNVSGTQAIITTAAHTGNYAADFGSVGSDGVLSQNLTTTAGQSYTFDFWLANLGGNPNDFTAKIGGVTEMHLANQAVEGYTHYVFDFTATGSTTPIEFDFRQDPSEWHLDDVSVVSGAAVRGLTVVGTSGSDTLANPTGTTSDTLIGNGGIDTFVFHGAAFGNDTIADFSTGTNHDIIQFDHTVFSKFSAIKAHAAQVGSNTVITVDAHDSVTLLGVSLSHLQASDFHFV
jgi:hypothetical protein